jgi:threonine synthase
LRLLATNRSDLARLVNAAHGSESSIVLRYKNALKFGATDREDSEIRDWFSRTSIREGARIFTLMTYKGVEIGIMDETSLMHTRTLKSVDGCVTAARCKHGGYQRVIFETGGNTGAPLTEYGLRVGLETYCFIPEENLPLLNSRVFESDRAHLLAVKEPGMVKEAARLFMERHGLKHIPEVEWRFEASTFRGMFLLEHLLGNGRFDWLVQTISAAFGPIGIYGVLQPFSAELAGVPRFLGVQQEANCPMYRMWKSEDHRNHSAEIRSTHQLLSRVMYDVRPHSYGTVEALKAILTGTNGNLTTINGSEFGGFLRQDFAGRGVLDRLADNRVAITLAGGEVVEKTGLMALAGAVKEIDAGTISTGERVLCCLTSGISDADGKAVPERVIESLDDLDGGSP